MKQTPKLYAYREFITDKESYAIDESGARTGETPNVAMDAGTPELAERIVRAYTAHDPLVHTMRRIANSNTADAGSKETAQAMLKYLGIDTLFPVGA